jgi:hypothetical protein
MRKWHRVCSLSFSLFFEDCTCQYRRVFGECGQYGGESMPPKKRLLRFLLFSTAMTSNDSQSIADAAKHRILHQPHLKMQRLWCECERGRLVLRGQVPSFYFKQLAQEAVAGLTGVRQVVNEIEVIW